MRDTIVPAVAHDYGMDLQEAIDAPRFVPQRDVVSLERRIPEIVRDGLRARGHSLVDADIPWGAAQAIYIDPASGVLHGACDPRKDGCAAGYGARGFPRTLRRRRRRSRRGESPTVRRAWRSIEFPCTSQAP